jgi:hypothetical protein
VRDYLLSHSHPVGRFKSRVFNALGYRHDAWSQLALDLGALASSGMAATGGQTPHGQKYEVSGKLQGPNGRTARFKTVWIVRTGEGFPRFVTAFPE